MSVERTRITVENLIADHVAVSFGQKNLRGPVESMAARIRSRITDRFRHGPLGPEQDNAPPVVRTLCNHLVKVPLPVEGNGRSQERTEQLALLRTTLEALRSENRIPAPYRALPVRLGLLLERQQIALKNEFVEGFGRIEMGLVAITVLALVMLRAIDFLWALPILALGIGRSWYLDRRCRKRLSRIAEIDALVGPIAATASCEPSGPPRTMHS